MRRWSLGTAKKFKNINFKNLIAVLYRWCTVCMVVVSLFMLSGSRIVKAQDEATASPMKPGLNIQKFKIDAFFLEGDGQSSTIGHYFQGEPLSPVQFDYQDYIMRQVANGYELVYNNIPSTLIFDDSEIDNQNYQLVFQKKGVEAQRAVFILLFEDLNGNTIKSDMKISFGEGGNLINFDTRLIADDFSRLGYDLVYSEFTDGSTFDFDKSSDQVYQIVFKRNPLLTQRAIIKSVLYDSTGLIKEEVSVIEGENNSYINFDYDDLVNKYSEIGYELVENELSYGQFFDSDTDFDQVFHLIFQKMGTKLQKASLINSVDLGGAGYSGKYSTVWGVAGSEINLDYKKLIENNSKLGLVVEKSEYNPGVTFDDDSSVEQIFKIHFIPDSNHETTHSEESIGESSESTNNEEPKGEDTDSNNSVDKPEATTYITISEPSYPPTSEPTENDNPETSNNNLEKWIKFELHFYRNNGDDNVITNGLFDIPGTPVVFDYHKYIKEWVDRGNELLFSDLPEKIVINDNYEEEQKYTMIFKEKGAIVQKATLVQEIERDGSSNTRELMSVWGRGGSPISFDLDSVVKNMKVQRYELINTQYFDGQVFDDDDRVDQVYTVKFKAIATENTSEELINSGVTSETTMTEGITQETAESSVLGENSESTTETSTTQSATPGSEGSSIFQQGGMAGPEDKTPSATTQEAAVTTQSVTKTEETTQAITSNVKVTTNTGKKDTGKVLPNTGVAETTSMALVALGLVASGLVLSTSKAKKSDN